jgi:hypothetical protein
VRNPEQEERVRGELKTLDPLLDLGWFETAAWNARTKRFEGRYGLTVRWAQADPRWELYRSGVIGEPFDLLGWFCEDLHSADTPGISPELLLDEVKRLLGKCDNAREPWKKRMKRAADHNIELRRKALSVVKDEAHETLADEYYGAHGPATRSYGGLEQEEERGATSQ